MVSSRVVLFLSAIFIFTAQAVAQPDFLYRVCSNDKGNYTANSTYEENLNRLLPALYSNTEINYGFYNSSYGQNSDEVYAIGLCRGDVKPDACRSCLKNATSLLKQLCPNQKEAMGWYENCRLRYSNRSLYGVVELFPRYYKWNNENISAAYVTQFNEDLRTLFESLISQASAGDSRLKFAANNATGPAFKTLYALVQCTPDLSKQDCSRCLRSELEAIPQCCDRKKGARVVGSSCNIRFEDFSFYNSTGVASPQKKTEEKVRERKGSLRKVWFYYYRREKLYKLTLCFIFTSIYSRNRYKRENSSGSVNSVLQLWKRYGAPYFWFLK